MGWSHLSFLAEPWFVIPWYAIGILGFAWVLADVRRTNTPLKKAMKWAWPIIVLFFSVIGLALYFGTARAPGVGGMRSDDEKQQAHDRYEQNMFRRVNGAVIHCVAGDGLGIMTAMVIARALGMSFWQEFWFEYVVGFAFGWLIFQRKSMTMMTDSTAGALAMAFRAEFFSMLTVMAGMGAVMTFVTPAVVTSQPQPLTYAFWGFGMLGLLAGYVLTFPMNWMMVKIGWKHGMGSSKGAHPVEGPAPKFALFGSMVVLGVAALVLPAWLTTVRETRPVAEAAPTLRASPQVVLKQGVHVSLQRASQHFAAGRRGQATHALDAARQGAEVGATAVPGGSFEGTLRDIKRARHALQMGDEENARRQLASASQSLATPGAEAVRLPVKVEDYEGVPLLNAEGVRIGEITHAEGDRVRLELGGARDLWGLWDVGTKQVASVPAEALLFGPRRTIGKSYAVLPTLQTPPVTLGEFPHAAQERPAGRRTVPER